MDFQFLIKLVIQWKDIEDIVCEQKLLNAAELKNTRLGLQCQTPALSKVYFTWAGTIILGFKNFGTKILN